MTQNHKMTNQTPQMWKMMTIQRSIYLLKNQYPKAQKLFDIFKLDILQVPVYTTNNTGQTEVDMRPRNK